MKAEGFALFFCKMIFLQGNGAHHAAGLEHDKLRENVFLFEAVMVGHIHHNLIFTGNQELSDFKPVRRAKTNTGAFTVDKQLCHFPYIAQVQQIISGFRYI